MEAIMIRGVVFDLDHTLFDRYATLKKVLPTFYHQYRSKIPAEMSVDAFIDRFILAEKRYIHFGWRKQIEACIEDGILISVAEEEYSEIIHFILHSCWTMDAVPYPFTESMLLKLRNMGCKIGIITNGSHDVQAKKIQILGLEAYCDEILISGDIGIHKPKPEPFLLMSERLGIPPQELLYVGDNPKNDVEGSRNAGYIPVWVKTTGYWCFDDVHRAEYEVETVEDIPALVERINGK